LGNALSGRINIPVTVTVAKEVILPPEIQVAFYRICQEALSNIAKHAKASQVEIDLKHDGIAVELHIRDDGLGFDPERNTSEHGHFGLSMMRERAEAAGARLTVTSQPGHGTELILQWTQNPQQEAE
jgi:signal transduction histidine kinase